MNSDYTVHYVPTVASPDKTRLWSSGHPHTTLADAREEASNYLATYPERRQCAQIVKTELVDVLFTRDNEGKAA